MFDITKAAYSKQTINVVTPEHVYGFVPAIPEGYEAVDFRLPESGDIVIGAVRHNVITIHPLQPSERATFPLIILRKIDPDASDFQEVYGCKREEFVFDDSKYVLTGEFKVPTSDEFWITKENRKVNFSGWSPAPKVGHGKRLIVRKKHQEYVMRFRETGEVRRPYPGEWFLETSTRPSRWVLSYDESYHPQILLQVVSHTKD